jgi:hypothetical protein
MRTKTLLIAAAALAVGIISSEAQVYSQNIVGYANVQTPGNGATYFAMSCPFNIGASNGANEVFGTSLPDYSLVESWDAVNQQVNIALWDSGGPNGAGWYDINDSFNVPIPTLPPGQGFFLVPYGNITNTFSGTVACAIGGTNTMTLNGNGATYFLAGSPVPFTGFVTNVTTGTSVGVNLNNYPDYSLVEQWDVPSQSFIVSLYDSGGPNGAGWYDINDSISQPCPTINVADGFFLVPYGTYNWVQALPSN